MTWWDMTSQQTLINCVSRCEKLSYGAEIVGGGRVDVGLTIEVDRRHILGRLSEAFVDDDNMKASTRVTFL
jgi:hypothetical protein